MTKVFNPTDKEVSLNYRGENFTIPAKTAEEFPKDVATHWVEIYGFMEIHNEDELAESNEKKVKKPK